MKNSYVNNLTITNLYKKKSLKSKIDTQLLYGDNFEIKQKLGVFSKIKIKNYFKSNKSLPPFPS